MTFASANGGTSAWLGLLFWVVVISVVLGWRWRNKRELAKIAVDTPVLLTLMGAGTGMGLEQLASGTLDGNPYTLMVLAPRTVPVSDGPTQYHGDLQDATAQSLATIARAAPTLSDMGSVIMTLSLPVKQAVHIAGFGIADAKTHQSFDRQMSDYNMEVVGLEGDFPDYFSLYCQKGKQVEVRQVLNPATMAFLVDFCQHEHWELFGDTLYFCQHKQAKVAADNSTMVEDAQNFLEQALPTLRRMSY